MTSGRWNVSRTKVTDAGLENVKGLKQLQRLVLDGTQITDNGLVNFKELDQLQYLSLRRTQVTDSGSTSRWAGSAPRVEL